MAATSSTGSSQNATSAVVSGSDKSDYQIQRLTGANWVTWKWQILNILAAKGLKVVLTTTTATPEQEVRARQIISSTLDQKVVNKVVHCETSTEIWACLQSIYENKTSFALTELISKMNSYRMKSLVDVENGISEIRSLAVQIQNMGGCIDRNTVESAILRALPKSFTSFITSWTFLDENKRSLDNLQAHIMRNVQILRADEKPTDKALVAQKVGGGGQQNNKFGNKKSFGENKKFNGTCHYCKKQGHMIKDCRKRKNSESTQSKTSSSGKENDNQAKDNTKEAPKGSLLIAINKPANLKVTKMVSDEFTNSIWIVDSGASFHMTSHLEWLSDYRELNDKLYLQLGDDSTIAAHGRGFIDTNHGTINNVYYVPESGANLLSIAACAKDNGIFTHCTDTEVVFKKGEKELFRGSLLENGIYKIDLLVKNARKVCYLAATLDDWHQRLGHISKETIKYMAENKLVDGLVIANDRSSQCEVCAESKITRCSHPTRKSIKANKPGVVLHFDTVGPMSETSLGGANYYVLCKDEFSSYRKVAFVSNKSEIPLYVKQFINETKLETGNSVLKICTDNGTEYKNREVDEFLAKDGTLHDLSAVYTPQQNGFIEREVRTVTEAARTLLLHSKLEKNFWAEAVNVAVYILNRTISSRKKDMTSYEGWFGKKPLLGNLHVFGQSAVIKLPDHKMEKFGPKGIKLTFIGYTSIYNSFRFIDLNNFKVYITADAVFLDNSDIISKEVKEVESEIVTIADDKDSSYETLETSDAESSDSTEITDHYEQQSAYEYNADYSTPPRPETIQEEEEDLEHLDLFETPARMPAERNKDLGRLGTLRPRKTKPNYMPPKPPVLKLSVLGSENDPASYSEAMARSDKGQWLEAMKDELESLRENKVFQIVEKPSKCNIVTNKWVLRIKRKPNGQVERYRARLVARGFSQRYGIDYNETYAPVANATSLRMIFAYAAIRGLKFGMYDIKAAFLYGDLEELVYMAQPEGFEDGTDRVWKLTKSLYGLKQAPRQWNIKFKEFLLSMKLAVSEFDQCIFYSFDPLIIMAIYVDDGIIFAENQETINMIMKQLKNRFKINAVENTTYLGFQIERTQDHKIFLHQESYINKILTKFNMQNSKPENSPISLTSGSEDLAPVSSDVPYREAIGSLMYAAVGTRLDIAFATGKASRAVENPLVKDWQGVKRILRYLVDKQDYGLCYSQANDDGLVAYCDADFAGDEATSRSTTGFVVLFGGAPIQWRSIRQKMVTTSSTEAEFVSLCTTIKEVICIRKLANELKLIENAPTKVYCDNESAIRLAKDDKCSQRTKHMRVQAAYPREQIEFGEVSIEHKKTDLQLADMLTKSTTVKQFVSNRDKLSVSKSTAALLLTFMALAAVTTAAYKFDTVRPIIYEPTERFIDTGVAEYTVDYTYANPCEVITTAYLKLRGPPIVTEAGQQMVDPELAMAETFVNDCNKMYEQTWLSKIEELLKYGVGKEQEFRVRDKPFNYQKKRSIIAGVVIGYCITNFLKTVYDKLAPWSQYNKIDEFQVRERQQLEKFQLELNVTNVVQQGMIELIKNNLKSIREQNRHLGHLAKLSAKVSWLASYVQTRMMFATIDLKTIVDELIHHKVATLEMSELLNISDFRGIDNIDTEFISATRLTSQSIQLKFNVRTKSEDSYIYKIHAFRYWENLTETPTLKEYQGERFVVYNATSHCLKGIEEPTQRAVLESCEQKNYIDPSTRLWRQLISTDDISSYKNSTAVKRTLLYNYIYCFPGEITIAEGKHKCPPAVFRVPVNMDWNTSDKSFVPTIRKLKISGRENPFIDDVHLNHFDEESLAANDAGMFEKVQSLRAKLRRLQVQRDTAITIQKSGTSYWSLITLFLLLVSACGILAIYSIHLTRQAHQNHQNIASDIRELRSEYQATSCINCVSNSLQRENSKGIQMRGLPRTPPNSVETSITSGSLGSVPVIKESKRV